MRIFKEKDGYKVQVNKDANHVALSTLYKDTVKKEENEENDAFEKRVLKTYKDASSRIDFIWNNNGVDAEGVQWALKDMYATPDAPVLLPKVVTTVVREAIEPMLIGTSLLQRINFTMGQTLVLPSASALSVAELDIPEAGEYPEAKISQGGSAMVANIGKSGIAVKITDEMVRYSQIDVINMHLRAAGRCLARHKEVKIFNMISNLGVVYFDNRNPTESVLGVTHGRDFNGAANGSVTTDDLFDIWGQVLARGFNGNTMLLHPLCFTMFCKDPNIRSMFFNANTNIMYATWRGNAKGGNPWATAAGGLSEGKYENIGPDTDVELRNQLLTSAPQLPGYLPNVMNVVVTPFAHYDVNTKTCHISIFDANELGVILVDEDPTTEEWADPARDIRKIKIRERYNLGILNEGQGVALIKNAVNVSNAISSQPSIPHIPVAALDKDGNPTVSGGLEQIPERVAIV